MIANKHTELRIYDNLNNLLQNALDEKEYKKKIDKNISKYIRNYIDEESWSKSIYDVFDDLSNEYQKHSWNIAENVEEEIFEEKAETNYLDPNVYTEEFRETLKEELVDKILERYFKVLNNQINVYEYKNKIEALKGRDVKKEYKEDEQHYKELVRNRIELVYKNYINQGHRAKEIITNFEYSRQVQDYIYKEIMFLVSDFLDDEVDSYIESKIRGLFEKELRAFIKEKKFFLDLNKKPQKQEKISVKVPKPIKWYAITKIWKDILK